MVNKIVSLATGNSLHCPPRYRFDEMLKFLYPNASARELKVEIRAEGGGESCMARPTSHMVFLLNAEVQDCPDHSPITAAVSNC